MGNSFDYETIVVGAGPSGGFASKEAARAGKSVLIVEKDLEVGYPEACGGLVSLRSLKEVFSYPEKVIKMIVKSGVAYVKDEGFGFSFERAPLAVLDRALFDKLIIKDAIKEGADLALGSYAVFKKENEENIVYIKNKTFTSKYLVNASGSSYYPKRNGKILTTQYMFALRDDFYDGIAIYINKQIMPTFFAWYIPYEDGLAKVGVPLPPSDSLKVAEKVLELLGLKGKPEKIVSSYVILGGPYKEENGEHFVNVGDAGGQTKPLTGGGIIYGSLGGQYAGKLIGEERLKDYNYEFYERGPGRDLLKQAKLRPIYESISDDAIYKMMKALKERGFELIDEEFDVQTKLIKRVLEDPGLALSLIRILPSFLIDYLKSELS